MTTPNDALDTLGTVLTGHHDRDAIHLAVLPAVAGEIITPGESVMLGRDGRAVETGCGLGIGIADPFLLADVEPGEQFWICVYPRTITSLRHEWTHPAIPNTVPGAATDGQGWVAKHTKAEAEEWLRNNIGDSSSRVGDDDCGYGGGDTFHTIIDKAETGHFEPAWGNDDESYLLLIGIDGHGPIPAEWWDYLESYVGHPVTNRATSWSCSC